MSRVYVTSRAFDPRNNWLAVGRTIIASSQISVLALTPPAYLFPMIGDESGPTCNTGIERISAYCIAGTHAQGELIRWSLVALLALIASGYRPRLTAPVHFWLSLSIGLSIGLPDGGESVGQILTLMLLPLCLVDGRRWQWTHPTAGLGPAASGVCFAAIWGVRIELAFIYLDSSISKFSVSAWANGTAEYYITRGRLFGATGPFGTIFQGFTSSALGTLALTWGALVAEIVIALLILTPNFGKRWALGLDVILHGSIIVSMGIWSFALIMIGFAAVAAMPLRTSSSAQNIGARRSKWLSAPVERVPKLATVEREEGVAGVNAREYN